jgi:hypothetical protein
MSGTNRAVAPDAVQGTTWEATGQTPGGSVPGQRQGISAASAVRSKGAFWFLTYPGGLHGEGFITRLRRMRCGRRRPLHLMLWTACRRTRPRRARSMSQGATASGCGMTCLALPPTSPPDELVWSHAKRTGTARRPRQQGEPLHERVIKQVA